MYRSQFEIEDNMEETNHYRKSSMKRFLVAYATMLRLGCLKDLKM